MVIETEKMLSLFRQPLSVANVGLDLFSEALQAQGIETTGIKWRPPAIDLDPGALTLFHDPGIEVANQEAVGRMMRARPTLVDVCPARGALPGMTERTFFRAGPPIDWAGASGPLRGALIGAMLYEGIANSPEQAARLGERGEIELAPCHEHEAVGPMAGVISPSMPVVVVENASGGNRGHCTFNEGLGKVLRYGAFGPEVIERLRWIEHSLAPLVGDAIRAGEGIDLRAITAQAIQMGDECHNRNKAGTSLLFRELAPRMVELDAPTTRIAEALRFIGANDHFYLNLAMPAAKVAADAAHGVANSTLVTTMARNGTDFGIRVSGLGDRWFTGPSQLPRGLYFAGQSADDANPDMGDSAITETAGIGGFAMAAAPAIVQFVGGTVPDALATTRRMDEIPVARDAR